ncbi:MAG: hypothetical protein RL653_1585 [Pseudomonadota bacterium]|jgi:hypothetical protein
MPSIQNQPLYDATFRHASTLAKQLGTAAFPWARLAHGDCLFRYSSQKWSDGEESGARAQWTPLDRDTGNRWSGSDNSGGGALGMYFSREEARSANTVFSELYHYLPDETLQHVPGQNEAISGVTYFSYLRNSLPKGLGLDGVLKWYSTANRAHYMFKWSLKKAVQGAELLVPSGAPGGMAQRQGFVDAVYARLGSDSQRLLQGSGGAARTARDLYLDPEDASFCRAIGNACLQKAGCEFLQVTSTRDKALKAESIVLNAEEAYTVPDVAKDKRGNGKRGIGYLQPLGRSTFFTDFFKNIQARVTTNDMRYNDQLSVPVYDGPLDDPAAA